MDNVIVLEASDDVNDCVYFADIGEKLVTKAFSGTGTFYKTGDVNKLDSGGKDGFGAADFCEDIEAFIGDAHHADIGFNRAEWEVSCLGLRVRDNSIE